MKTGEETKSIDPKEPKRPGTAVKKKSVIKKLSPEACKVLQGLSEKANKKTYGRKVRDGDIIALALSLVQAKHIEELQEQSLTERDRLSLAHDNYQKSNGKITLDEFIGKLIRGEIRSSLQK